MAKKAKAAAVPGKNPAKKVRRRDQQTLQVKPIFSVAPVLPLASGPTRFVVRLEKPVAIDETYDIRKAPLGDSLDGDAKFSKTTVVVKSGYTAEITITPTKRGWVFFRFTERTRHGQVLGAIYIE